MVFLFNIVWVALVPILPLYSIEIGASILLTGVILSVFHFMMIIALIPVGLMVRKKNVKKILALSYLTQIAALILLASAWNAIILFLAIGLFGFGYSFFLPVSVSISMSKSIGGDRGKIAGNFFTALGLGLLIGPLLIGFLIQHLSYRASFICIIIFPVSGLIILFHNLARKRNIPFNDIACAGSLKSNTSVRRLVFNILIQGRSIILLTDIFFFITIGFFNVLFPIYGKSSLMFDASTISLLFAIRGTMNISLRTPSGILSDYIGRKKILTTAYFIAIISFIMLILTNGLYFIAIAIALLGMAHGIQHPVALATIEDGLPINLISFATAAFFTCTSIGFFIGSILAGVAANLYPWHIIMVQQAFLMVMSIILITLIFKEKMGISARF